MSEGLKICGEGARSKVVGIIYPLINIGLTDHPKTGGTRVPPPYVPGGTNGESSTLFETYK